MAFRSLLTSRAWAILALALLATPIAAPGPANAGSTLRGYSDDALSHGFFSTVFGIEHGARAGGTFVKKFHAPVRFAVENRSSKGLDRQVAKFIRGLPRVVPGLDARLAGAGERPNFVVHIVNRADYAPLVREVAYGGAHGKVPGRCMVKVDFGRGGIQRADAFIVADEGGHLFRRCMVEEILQGLGPMNDHDSLADSVFNDESRHDRLMAFDRAIVTMLYDNRVRHGMRVREVQAIMPDLVAEARRRVR